VEDFLARYAQLVSGNPLQTASTMHSSLIHHGIPFNGKCELHVNCEAPSGGVIKPNHVNQEPNQTKPSSTATCSIPKLVDGTWYPYVPPPPLSLSLPLDDSLQDLEHRYRDASSERKNLERNRSRRHMPAPCEADARESTTSSPICKRVVCSGSAGSRIALAHMGELKAQSWQPRSV
jgi:hypothetical protein